MIFKRLSIVSMKVLVDYAKGVIQSIQIIDWQMLFLNKLTITAENISTQPINSDLGRMEPWTLS